MSSSVSTKPRTIRAATRTDAFERLSRSGFVARGLIYVIVGVLAVKLAMGSRGADASQQGALEAIAHQPFGKVLLIVVAIGLAGYALWRMSHAVFGSGRERADGALDRVTAFASGIVYAGLCAVAVEILLGAGSGGAGTPHHAAAGVLGWPAGAWLVGIAGVVLIGVGLYQGYRALSKEFLEDSKTEEMGPAVRRWIEGLGVFGYLARMVVFVLIGAFLVKSAIDFNPGNAVGLDGALARLSHSAYGPFLLGVVAAGLVAFGIYSFSDARYRRI
jgi:fumarate reductase subunit D